VLLCGDWTLLRLFPPLRAAWALQGTQAAVPIAGANAKRVLFGAINLCTAHRIVLVRSRAGGADARAFLRELRRRYRAAEVAPFRWTPMMLSHKVVLDAQEPSLVCAGVPAPDGRVGACRT
jgi:hypothetical protein